MGCHQPEHDEEIDQSVCETSKGEHSAYHPAGDDDPPVAGRPEDGRCDKTGGIEVNGVHVGAGGALVLAMIPALAFREIDPSRAAPWL